MNIFKYFFRKNSRTTSHIQAANKGIPVFPDDYPVHYEMDSRQAEFYIFFEKSLQSGNYVDIQGNVGYIFTYFFRLENITYDSFISEIQKAKESYGKYKHFESFCNRLLCEYHMIKKDYKKALYFYNENSYTVWHKFLNSLHYTLLKNTGEVIV